MSELTTEQLGRQDFVDNAIYELIRSVNPSEKDIEWDIEMIGDVRDRIEEWFVERLQLMDEATFYPHAEE